MAKAGMRKALTPEEAAKKRAEWNIYEWDKPEQYEYAKQLKGDRLRWEFLRRDEDYHVKYKKYHTEGPHPLLGKYINPQKRGDELPGDFRFLDTTRRGEPLRLPAPAVKTMLFTREEVSADNKIRAHYGYWLEQLYELGYVVMAFDPARTPTSQIRSASLLMKNAHEKYAELYPKHTIKGKRSPKDAAKLLRVVDAALVGINNQIIGADIYGIEEYDKQIAVGQERLKAARSYWRVM